jgi:hypothetical protein
MGYTTKLFEIDGAGKRVRNNTELDLMEVINDPQFRHIAEIMRKCFYSRYWREAHPKVSFLGRLGTVTKMAKRELMRDPQHRLKIHEELTGLLRDIGKSNYRDGAAKVRYSNMSYTEDDAQWLTEVLVVGNYQHAATILSMLLAYARAKASPGNVEGVGSQIRPGELYLDRSPAQGAGNSS